MAWHDKYGWDTGGWRAPQSFSDNAVANFEKLVDIDNALATDSQAQGLFHLAMYNMDIRPIERDYAYMALIEYLNEQYGLDFVEEFDWESYREWYDNV